MASGLYDKGRQKFLEGSIAWLTDNIKATLVDLNDYTHSLSGNEFLSDIPPAARVAISSNFTNKTSINGIADADDVILSLVSGDVCEAIVIFKDTGNPATSPLIAFLDSSNVTNIPVTPIGADITIRWSNFPDRIFKL